MKNKQKQTGESPITALIFWILVGIGIFFAFFKEDKGVKENRVKQERVVAQEAMKEVFVFVKEFSPELLNKVSEIQTELTNAGASISKLNILAKKFPDQRKLIDESVKTWEEIRNTLGIASDDIEKNLRASYVAYKIDEIKGRKSFESIKSQLLEKANQSLASANNLRSTIQEVSAK